MLAGELLEVLNLPGGNPNLIVPFGDLTVIPYLKGNAGMKGQPDNGFISILDKDHKILSKLAAPAPVYTDGKLASLGSNTKLFTYPHGILIDDQQSIYVAQWNSGKTYPIKLESVEF